MKRRKREHAVRRTLARMLVYLIIAVFALYTLVPIVTVVITSIRSEKDLAEGPFTLPRQIQISANFRKAWIDGNFRSYFKNSVFITIPTVLLCISLSTIAGYAFAKIPFVGSKVLVSYMLIGMMIPFQAVMIPLYFLLKDLHLLNSLLGVVLVIAAFSVSFGSFMMRGFFRGLPDELIEAAKLDSCSDLQTFWYVMLPLTYPAWISLIVFQSMWTWNNLLVPLLFIYDEGKRPLSLALLSYQDRYTTSYTLVAAAVLITILPLVVLFVTLQRRFITSITMGAVKG